MKQNRVTTISASSIPDATKAVLDLLKEDEDFQEHMMKSDNAREVGLMLEEWCEADLLEPDDETLAAELLKLAVKGVDTNKVWDVVEKLKEEEEEDEE